MGTDLLSTGGSALNNGQGLNIKHVVKELLGTEKTPAGETNYAMTRNIVKASSDDTKMTEKIKQILENKAPLV